MLKRSQNYPQTMAVIALLATVGVALTAGTAPTRRAAAPPADPYAYLDQNWDSGMRQAWYVTPQGSLMMPYDWWFALEEADAPKLFKDDLEKFGILPGPPSLMNPDHLPLGFAREEVAQEYNGISARIWIGPTCAACHTSALKYKKPGDAQETTLVVDGGQSHLDYGAFRAALSAAISQTQSDRAKFDRFAKRVLSKATVGEATVNRERLRAEFERYAERMAKEHYNDAASVAWGPSRIDAFGVIFNRVGTLSLGVPANRRVNDAPVSIPFLWNIHRQSHLQWHGETVNARDADHLGRNAGEVLGSYGSLTIDLTKSVFPSSINAPNLVAMENWLGDLKAPKWPEELLGKIDRDAARRGQSLYQRNCVSCHTVLGDDKTQVAPITPVPLLTVGTDPNMTVNFHTRMIQTGPLKGQPMGGPSSPKFGATARMMDVMNYLALHWDVNAKSGVKIEPYTPLPQDLPAFRDDIKNWGYEAKPLHGVWASAPFLHNGSVPSLYQLLLPPGQRLKTFYVGTFSFDPVNVGYQTEARYGGTLLDTRRPGNLNTGHEYGTALSEAERKDLMEYLKTL